MVRALLYLIVLSFLSMNVFNECPNANESIPKNMRN